MLKHKHKWRIVLGCIACVLVILAIDSLFVPIYREICTKYEYTCEKESAPYHIAPFIIFYVGKILEDHNGAVTGIATVFLTIITGWLVIVARDQSKTTRAQLRAYVMVETAITLDFGPRPKAQVVLRNFGKTPAHDLTLWTSVEVAADPLSEKPAAPVGRADPIGPLGPGAHVHTLDPPSHIIKAEEIASVQNGTAGFYVFGQAQYDDVFGENHTTDFCFIYGGRDGCHPKGAMAQYKDWNKAT